MEQMSLFSIYAPQQTDKKQKSSNAKPKNQKTTVKPSIEKPKQMPVTEKDNAMWSGIDPQTINDVLLRGSNVENGKKRIYDFFMREKDEEKRAKMLKDEYGIGGWCGPNSPMVNFDSKGLSISNKNDNIILTWRNVAERIGKLIHYNLYYA